MVCKAIREFHAKRLLSQWLAHYSNNAVSYKLRAALVHKDQSFQSQVAANPWMLTEKLVVKPDQLIKRRGKRGLILLNATAQEAEKWINERIGTEVEADNVLGTLTHFLVEPFVPHQQEQEMYVCIRSVRGGNEILFCTTGGINVGDVDAKARRYTVPIDDEPDQAAIISTLLVDVADQELKKQLAIYLAALVQIVVNLHYSYLEINPLVVLSSTEIMALDMACKLDTCGEFMCGKSWGDIEFPASFGRALTPEEAYIAGLDAKSGASLKLTILNPKGRVWPMVAGGGASVIYTDTIADLGAGAEIANYGEYSGNPTESETFEYAKTLFTLLTRYPEVKNKVLLIGGGIANFTNVADTFKGIVRAFRQFADAFRDQGIRVYVRRGGPNYQAGLDMMRRLGAELSLPIEVYGPETHLTAIVPMALNAGKTQAEDPAAKQKMEESFIAPVRALLERQAQHPSTCAFALPTEKYQLFDNNTRCLIYGMQNTAIQGMLDFDFAAGRKTPSIAGIVYPFATDNHTTFQKFFFGTKEQLFPVYENVKSACDANPDVTVMVNFASFRSAYDSTMEALRCPIIRVIAIIAEGIPEVHARKIMTESQRRGVTVIGPATVGGCKPGAFRIGNSGGMMENVIDSKLHRPGHVAYVARSGGMSNELNNIVARNSDGAYEGIAVGGDKYASTTFIDHMMRYESDPNIKMLILLGEVGGTDEYDVINAMKEGKITKPMVAWCTGTCAKVFPYEVQFGHAGALAKAAMETADAKNQAFREAGAIVPDSFEHFGVAIKTVFDFLVKQGVITPTAEPPKPKIPMDYAWAQKLGMIRKPANFVSTISDDRGEELVYAGMPINKVFEKEIGIGGVISLLWFKRLLPPYACKFLEMVVQVTADHGPAVSGAHNTIVTARAGKDLISALVTGLLTIGPRFGGAIDQAAVMFSEGYDRNLTPAGFVEQMRKERRLIMGIGHRVKSLKNPDMRVSILKAFAKKNFPSCPLLCYAEQVELLTTQKKANLILNVDGCVGVLFVDLLRSCGCFTPEEAKQYIELGCINALFVVGRSIGLIGHYLDQKRLQQPLYRHPWEDICYMLPQWKDTDAPAKQQ